jgi:hypothetical protein
MLIEHSKVKISSCLFEGNAGMVDLFWRQVALLSLIIVFSLETEQPGVMVVQFTCEKAF